jgi:hypothetical protein
MTPLPAARYREIVEIYHRNLAALNPKAAAEYPVDKVRNTPSWPRRWANCSWANLPVCIPTGVRGPTRTCWASLTPRSPKLYADTCLTLAIIYPAILPPFLAGTIAGAAQLPEEKRKYTFEVFYNLSGPPGAVKWISHSPQ